MECLFCNKPLTPVRAPTDAEFCSDDHLLCAAGEEPTDLYHFFEPGLQSCAAPFAASGQLGGAAGALQFPSGPAPALDWVLAEPLKHCFPLDLIPDPAPPPAHAPELPVKAQFIPLEFPSARLAGFKPVALKRPNPIVATVQRLPVLKIASIAAVLLAILYAAPLSRRVAENSRPPIFSNVVHQVRGAIGHRAAVDLNDDFRSGLGDWKTKSGGSSTWTFDRTGLVQPGALAVFRPTVDLSDYNVDFTAQVAQTPLGIAFRIQDWENYYAVKLRVDRSGPQQRIEMARYAVVNGREAERRTHSIPAPVQNLSIHQIRLKLKDSDFTLIADGHLVDYWSDGRYGKGGFGFFSGKGEHARVISVEVSHQHDWLGRFCALLTPYQD